MGTPKYLIEGVIELEKSLFDNLRVIGGIWKEKRRWMRVRRDLVGILVGEEFVEVLMISFNI